MDSIRAKIRIRTKSQRRGRVLPGSIGPGHTISFKHKELWAYWELKDPELQALKKGEEIFLNPFFFMKVG